MHCNVEQWQILAFHHQRGKSVKLLPERSNNIILVIRHDEKKSPAVVPFTSTSTDQLETGCLHCGNFVSGLPFNLPMTRSPLQLLLGQLHQGPQLLSSTDD